MAEFKYRASDPSGKISTGIISASDKKEVTAQLATMKLVPLSIKPLSDSDVESAQEGSQLSKKIGGEKTALAFFKKLKQLCGGGGMPVSDAIKALGLRSLDPKVKMLSAELYKDLSEGKTLASALQKFPETFDTSITHLVEAGESTANLIFVFDNIVEYIEDRRKLRATIVSALAYPIFLCLMASGVVMLFLFFMLPKIKSMMQNMGAGENTPVKMMSLIGDVLMTGVPTLLGVVLVSAILIHLYKRTEEGKRNVDAFMLKVPAIGKIIFDSDVCRFSNLASTLFASGVNTTETFRLAEKSIHNTAIRSRFRQFRTSVNDGAPISAALRRYELLDDEDVDIVSVGERTGSLVSAFGELNSAHSESLKRRIKMATAGLGGFALGFAFLLVFVFATGIVLSVLGLSQGIIAK